MMMVQIYVVVVVAAAAAVVVVVANGADYLLLWTFELQSALSSSRGKLGITSNQDIIEG